MGDTIQNMLQTGYFTTSRARNAGPPSPSLRPPPKSPSPRPDSVPPPVPVHGEVPRTVYLAPAPRRFRPPPVTVEDEVESLAREYGSSAAATISDEETPSRGDVDQYPVIMEVHEHNPERRFVIVPECSQDQNCTATDTDQPEDRLAKEDGRDCNTAKVHTTEGDRGEHEDPGDISRYGLERRRSQQDLPPLDTDLEAERQPSHHRTRSAAARPRPEYYDSRSSRPFGDQMLSPEVITNGPKGRERTYQSQGFYYGGSSRRSPSRSRTSSQADTGRRDQHLDYHGRSRGASSARRSKTDLVDSQPPRDRMTNDVDLHSENAHPNSRTNKRDSSEYRRVDGHRGKHTGASRDPSRSGDDYSRSPQRSDYLPSKPVIVQDGTPPARQKTMDNGRGHSRSSSRTSTFPLTARAAAANHAAYETSNQPTREAAKGRPPMVEESPIQTTSQLPYPDDDHLPGHGILSDASTRSPHVADMTNISMPEPPSSLHAPYGRALEATKGTPATLPPASTTPQTRQTLASEPEQDGHSTDKLVGSCKRHSESHDTDTVDALPDCARRKPVAGMVDWLTIPHTNFNICPKCYDAVFAKSNHRTLFKPMLRPTDEAIACDFGSSPWYRIAWLLTLKDQVPDLRLLKQIANNQKESLSTREVCPGSKKATRNWLTVRDPITRQPVSDFTICYPCTRTVELLLPNLTGVFQPLDSRPRSDVCALHFTPERKDFALVFDVLETTSDKAMLAKKPPNMDDLSRQLWQLTVGDKCREDTPVRDGYWHMMQFLPELTVCKNCFDSVVKPQLEEGNVLAQNFYKTAQRLPSATCQLYSTRMRDVFRRSCRRNDPAYLEDKVMERRDIEKDIYEKLVKLDRAEVSSSWKEEQVEKLVEKWKRWE